jgi:hypothetical protein
VPGHRLGRCASLVPRGPEPSGYLREESCLANVMAGSPGQEPQGRSPPSLLRRYYGTVFGPSRAR